MKREMKFMFLVVMGILNFIAPSVKDQATLYHRQNKFSGPIHEELTLGLKLFLEWPL